MKWVGDGNGVVILIVRGVSILRDMALRVCSQEDPTRVVVSGTDRMIADCRGADWRKDDIHQIMLVIVRESSGVREPICKRLEIRPRV